MKPSDLLFLYKNENYMTAMQRDLEFLRKSAFKRVLNLKIKSVDPLFILASRPTSNGKVNIPLRGFMENRIVNAENAIFDEIPSPDIIIDEPSPRTPLKTDTVASFLPLSKGS